MIFQANLEGKPIKPADPEEPWKSLGCCEACYNAEGERCKCRCGGAFHGLGRVNKHNGDAKQKEED